MESFEDQMKAYCEDSNVLYAIDAIRIAREADAALADQAYRLEVQQKTLESTYAALQRKDNDIDRRTALNTAKGELIEFYEYHLSQYTMFAQNHHIVTSLDQIEKGEQLRAYIRSLENE